MSGQERVLSSPDDVFLEIDENLPKRLPPYRRIDPKDRSREMQKAAFGDEAVEVNTAQYKELIKQIRGLRPWLRGNGKTKQDDPAYAKNNHEIYWLKNTAQDGTFSIVYHPHAWERSAGYSREPYPKFSLGLEDEIRAIDFAVNFDNTYTLRIKNKQTQAEPFEISGLKRKHMTTNEYKVVKYVITRVAAHFDIPEELLL